MNYTFNFKRSNFQTSGNNFKEIYKSLVKDPKSLFEVTEEISVTVVLTFSDNKKVIKKTNISLDFFENDQNELEKSCVSQVLFKMKSFEFVELDNLKKLQLLYLTDDIDVENRHMFTLNNNSTYFFEPNNRSDLVEYLVELFKIRDESKF